MSYDQIGDRFKEYENAYRTYLSRRIPIIIRLDGKAFHTFTKKYKKPWDEKIRDAFIFAGERLLKEIQGSKLIYCQSDEMSILLTNNDEITTEAWFGNNLQKMVSVSTSMLTAYFNDYIKDESRLALFDARVFILPYYEVENYFIWRQLDCIRNSKMSLAQSYFSHKELQGITANQAKQKLLEEKDVLWENCEKWQKDGWCLYRNAEMQNIVIDKEISLFSDNRNYIRQHLPEFINQ